MHGWVSAFLFALTLSSGCGVLNASESDTWVLIVCTSRYWFNYRHEANALAMYKQARRLGVEDDHIVFMSSLDASDDPRNPFPGYMFTANHNPLEQHQNARAKAESISLDTHTFYKQGSTHVEMDYRGEDCNSDNFLRVLTGRHAPDTPLSKRLQSTRNSKVLVYLSGHGGDGFLKFHDQQELSSADLAYALQQMWLYGRYGELLLIIDTCQASSMAEHLSAATPHVSYISSSNVGENSYAYDTNYWLGLAVMDRFTFQVHSFLSEKLPSRRAAGQPAPAQKARAPATVADLVRHLRHKDMRRFLYSTVTLVQTPGSRSPREMQLSEFFGSSIPNDDEHVSAASASGVEQQLSDVFFDSFPAFSEWSQ